jgi:Uma2 family endonuclease
MAIQRNAHNERLTLEEYFALLEKDLEHGYEYLDGRVYMMTGGSPDYSIIGSNMNGMIRDLLKGRRYIVYNSDVYFQISENYRVCPDVSVSCDPRDRGAQEAIHYPSVVVEVLSPTTEAQDRGEKSLQYRSCSSIQEYLLINSQIPIIELFRREKYGFWTLYTLRPGESVELTSLDIRFPVADVYQDTSLMEESND